MKSKVLVLIATTVLVLLSACTREFLATEANCYNQLGAGAVVSCK